MSRMTITTTILQTAVHIIHMHILYSHSLVHANAHTCMHIHMSPLITETPVVVAS